MELDNTNFDFYVTSTRLSEQDPWTGRRGRINADWVKEHIGDVTKTVFYACGPNELVAASQHLVLQDLGIPKNQMLVEKWG